MTKRIEQKPAMAAKKRNGFTLIEIILALMLVSIGIVAVIGLLGSALDTSGKSHDDLNVVSFADMVFNYYHAHDDWSDIPPEGSWHIPDYAGTDTDLQNGTYTCLLPGYAGVDKEAYTVTYSLDAEEIGKLKALTLYVWPGYSTNGQPRRFYTEIYNQGGTP